MGSPDKLKGSIHSVDAIEVFLSEYSMELFERLSSECRQRPFLPHMVVSFDRMPIFCSSAMEITGASANFAPRPPKALQATQVSQAAERTAALMFDSLWPLRPFGPNPRLKPSLPDSLKPAFLIKHVLLPFDILCCLHSNVDLTQAASRSILLLNINSISFGCHLATLEDVPMHGPSLAAI